MLGSVLEQKAPGHSILSSPAVLFICRIFALFVFVCWCYLYFFQRCISCVLQAAMTRLCLCVSLTFTAMCLNCICTVFVFAFELQTSANDVSSVLQAGMTCASLSLNSATILFLCSLEHVKTATQYFSSKLVSGCSESFDERSSLGGNLSGCGVHWGVDMIQF